MAEDCLFVFQVKHILHHGYAVTPVWPQPDEGRRAHNADILVQRVTWAKEVTHVQLSC